MGKVLESAGAAADDGPGVPLAVLGWGATAGGYLAAAANDELDDLIVTSRRAYHLVRQLDGGSGQLLLVYLRLDRARANLAVARRALSAVRAAPASVPRPREIERKQETPAQRGSTGERTSTGRGALALVAPAPPSRPAPSQPAPGPSAPSPASMPRRQVAALPLPRRQPATPRAGPRQSPAPAPSPAPSPLPRRTAGAPPPAAPRAERPAGPGPRWANDVSTMRRLLGALRQLR